jgi:uncharacterized membrane-anchored protein YitT (DUF2179 family)
MMGPVEHHRSDFSPATAGDPQAVESALRHTWLEDLQALMIGTLLVALGVTIFKHAGLLSGGTVGIALIMHHLSGWPLGWTYCLINLPFYGLAWRHMGRSFTLRTIGAVLLVSVLSDWLPQQLTFARLDPPLAAVLGGILMGNGFLVLFRHRASLGGLGVVALLLQRSRGWPAGHIQGAIDTIIVAAAMFSVPWPRVLLSVLAVVVLNLVLATNHRPGRYIAH